MTDETDWRVEAARRAREYRAKEAMKQRAYRASYKLRRDLRLLRDALADSCRSVTAQTIDLAPKGPTCAIPEEMMHRIRRYPHD